MQAGELLSLIKNPASLKQEDVARLERITSDFPYFQPAQLLLCMAARKWDAGVYQHQLKRTAITASSRSHLYDLIKGVEKDMQTPAANTSESKGTAEIKPKLRDQSTEEELRIVNANAESAKGPKDKPLQGISSFLEAELPEDFLEQEIQKQVTAAVVDKEIISAGKDVVPEAKSEAIPEEKQDESGSFSDWLEQLKKPAETPKASLKKKKENPEEAANKAKPQSQPQPLSAQASFSHEAKKDQPQSEDLQNAKRIKQKALIDKIIENSPGVIRPKEDQKFFTPERKAKESLLENEHLVTETLAKIYAMQGNISKAIRSYEILSLKYPQKSAYFASLIQKLKQNQ
jgi:hypothetical protein